MSGVFIPDWACSQRNINGEDCYWIPVLGRSYYWPWHWPQAYMICYSSEWTAYNGKDKPRWTESDKLPGGGMWVIGGGDNDENYIDFKKGEFEKYGFNNNFANYEIKNLIFKNPWR